jgi:hypothetical protein
VDLFFPRWLERGATLLDVVQLFSDEKPSIELWLDKISYGPVGREVE